MPPNVILQPFTDAPTQPGAVARAFRALAASVRAMLKPRSSLAPVLRLQGRDVGGTVERPARVDADDLVAPRDAPELAAELLRTAVAAVAERDQVAARLLLAEGRVGQVVRAELGRRAAALDLAGRRELQLRLRPPSPVAGRVVRGRAERRSAR